MQQAQDRRPLLARMRRQRLWLRTIAILVTAAFLNLYLQPLALAANLPSRPEPKAPTNEEKLSKKLQTIEDRLEKLETKLEKREDATREKTELNAMRQELDTLDARVIKDFEAIEKRLRNKKLPQVILDRHLRAVSGYKQEMQILKANLDDVEVSDDVGDRRVKVKRAREHIRLQQKKRAHTHLDPNSLPFRVPDGKVRKPKQTPAEYRALFKPEPIRLASTELTAGMFLADLLPAALIATASPADLSATEDVQITDDIRALASSLGNNPVEIYNWVHNNIYFVPTYGSIQGSQMCLETKQCNAFDTASLLIALFRVSDIPARYVYGTVQIPIEKVMNWVGGAAAPEAALQLLGQGGVPNIGVVQGGRIVAVQFEHVWVEAFVDFIPNRGATHKQGDTWIGMDASFKQYQYTQRLDLRAVAFDQSTLDQLLTAVTATTDGTVTNIDGALIQTGFDAAYTRVKNYIEQTRPDASAADIVGSQVIVQASDSVLASKLPYAAVVTGTRFAALPSDLRHHLSINLYADSLNRSLNRPDLSYQIGLPSLGYKTFTLSYNAATSDDLAALASNLDSDGAVPPYLIAVTPVLKLAGDTVAFGPSVGLAQQQQMTLTITSPNMPPVAQTKVLTVGSYNAIVPQYSAVMPVHFQRIASDMAATRAKLQSADIADLRKDDLYGIILHSAGLGYWAQSELFNRIGAVETKVIRNPFQRVGVFSLDLDTQYAFGTPIKAKTGSFVSDVRISIETAISAAGDAAKVKDYLLSSLTLMSRLEGTIWEQVVKDGPGRGVTTATLLAQAGQGVIPIYEMRADNVSAIMPLLTVDSAVKQDILSAVAAGKVVYVARDSVTVDGWTGAGYVVRDPETGSAAYLISGGLNGGEYAAAIGRLQTAAGGLEDTAQILGILADSASLLIKALGLAATLTLLAPFLLVIGLLLQLVELLATLTQYVHLDCFPGTDRTNFVVGLLIIFLVSALVPFPFGTVAGIFLQIAYLYEWGGILRLLVAEAFIRGQSCRIPIPRH